MKWKWKYFTAFIFLTAGACFSQKDVIDIAGDSILRKIRSELPAGWTMSVVNCPEACSLMVERKDSVFEFSTDSLNNCSAKSGKRNVCDINWIPKGGDAHKARCWFVFTDKISLEKIKANEAFNDSIQKRIGIIQKQKKTKSTDPKKAQENFQIDVYNDKVNHKILEEQKKLIPILVHCTQKYHVLQEYWYDPDAARYEVYPVKGRQEMSMVYDMIKKHMQESCNYGLH